MTKSIVLSVIFIFILFSTVIGQEKKEDKENTIPINWGVWTISSFSWDDTDNLTPATQFNLNAARLIATGEPVDNVSYHVMGDFSSPDYSPRLMQAWVEYKPVKYLSIRAGQFKYPFVSDAYPPLIYWKFANVSYTTANIVKKLGYTGSLFRDIGVQAYCNYDISKELSLNCKLMVMNGTGANAKDNNSPKDFVGFLGFKIINFINVGGSYYFGKSLPDSIEVDESAYGLQLKVEKEKFSFQAEYLLAKYDANITRKEVSPSGYYVYGTYKVIPTIEFGFRYDFLNQDKNIDNNNKSRVTLSASYLFDKKSRIMINYEIRNDDIISNMGNLLTILGQVAI